MTGLFFAIYKDADKKLTHTILYRESKEVLKTELKESGFSVKAILSTKDIDQIESDEFYCTQVSDKIIDYFKQNSKDWDKAK